MCVDQRLTREHRPRYDQVSAVLGDEHVVADDDLVVLPIAHDASVFIPAGLPNYGSVGRRKVQIRV